jgi:hypothetical protein
LFGTENPQLILSLHLEPQSGKTLIPTIASEDYARFFIDMCSEVKIWKKFELQRGKETDDLFINRLYEALKQS